MDFMDVVDLCARNWSFYATHFDIPNVGKPHKAAMGLSGTPGLCAFGNS